MKRRLRSKFFWGAWLQKSDGPKAVAAREMKRVFEGLFRLGQESKRCPRTVQHAVQNCLPHASSKHDKQTRTSDHEVYERIEDSFGRALSAPLDDDP